jgi:8-oxo-dGTP pyrophosphatase MutT (NUDIX family)
MKSGVSVLTLGRAAAECVSGILLDDGSVLVEKRRVDDDADPGQVLLPGGYVEVGESLNQALKREMREELGI